MGGVGAGWGALELQEWDGEGQRHGVGKGGRAMAGLGWGRMARGELWGCDGWDGAVGVVGA